MSADAITVNKPGTVPGVSMAPPLRGLVQWEITQIDLWEQDATITIGGQTFYFQFSDKEGPTLAAAIGYLKQETKP